MGTMLNVLKRLSSQFSSPTANASLLVAASKLILATCESDYVDSRGGPGNHDENGDAIPMTKFNDVKVRRDAVIQVLFKRVTACSAIAVSLALDGRGRSL